MTRTDIRVQVCLQPKMHELVQKYKLKNGSSASVLMNLALKEYFSKNQLETNNLVETILYRETRKLPQGLPCFICDEYLPVGTECVVTISEFNSKLAIVGMHQECSDFNDFLESI